MKRIEAIIRPSKLPQVLEALQQDTDVAATVLDVTGFGRQAGHSEVYRGVEQEKGLVPKRLLILYVNDDQVEHLVRTICELSQTGKPGDGKVAVLPVECFTRIRTGEEGEVAL
jgi:nitrogen regulatory protein P-II 1